MHTFQLHVWELFVFAHEIGHIVAGHIESDDAVWKANHEMAMIDCFQENSSYAKETQADILAYLFTQECLFGLGYSSSELADDRPLLLSIVKLFDLLFLIGSRESKSHPDPTDRLCNIAVAVYGENVAQILADGFRIDKYFERLFEQPIVAKPGSQDP